VPAFAHTSLAGSSPEDGDVLTEQPQHLHLTFSGELESSLHRVDLTGPDGAGVALGEAALDSNGRSLTTELPELPNGTYRVAYRVISADGHPIEGGFAFEVAVEAPPSDAAQPGEVPAPAEGVAPDEGTAEDGAGGGASGPSPDEAAEPAPAASGASPVFAAFLHLSRIVYYLTLLPLVGWALWSGLRPAAADRLAYWRSIGLRLQIAHLAAFIPMVALHWIELSGGTADVSFLDTLRDTSVGQSWLFTGLLSLAGFPLLFRQRPVDLVWAALMIAAKTLRGHAGAHEPVVLSRLTDAVHLGAAALWLGGLLAMALLLRKFPDWFRSFAPMFSAFAFAAFGVLAATGLLTIALYTEDWGDVLRTTWGWLLVAKTALALAVLPVAAALRRNMTLASQRPDAFRRWLRFDLGLLVGIVAVTAVLTHISPVVERIPFHWHVMGETAHMTLDIEDVRPGENELALKVWAPTGERSPAVTVTSIDPDGTERPAALAASDIEPEPWETFEGFDRYDFTGELDIADPGAAEIRVRIQRENGETIDYRKKLIDP